MGKSTISMAIFNSYVSLPEGINHVEARQVPIRSRNQLLELRTSWEPQRDLHLQMFDGQTMGLMWYGHALISRISLESV